MNPRKRGVVNGKLLIKVSRRTSTKKTSKDGARKRPMQNLSKWASPTCPNDESHLKRHPNITSKRWQMGSRMINIISLWKRVLIRFRVCHDQRASSLTTTTQPASRYQNRLIALKTFQVLNSSPDLLWTRIIANTKRLNWSMSKMETATKILKLWVMWMISWCLCVLLFLKTAEEISPWQEKKSAASPSKNSRKLINRNLVIT